MSCISILTATSIKGYHVFGDIWEGFILGSKHVEADIPTEDNMEYTRVEFTYPKVNNI